MLPGQKERLAMHGNPKTFTYALMDMLWSKEILATHSLTGKVSNAHKEKNAKPCLDASKVAAICGMYNVQYNMMSYHNQNKLVQLYVNVVCHNQC